MLYDMLAMEWKQKLQLSRLGEPLKGNLTLKGEAMPFGDRGSTVKVTELPIPWTKTTKELGVVLTIID